MHEAFSASCYGRRHIAWRAQTVRLPRLNPKYAAELPFHMTDRLGIFGQRMIAKTADPVFRPDRDGREPTPPAMPGRRQLHAVLGFTSDAIAAVIAEPKLPPRGAQAGRLPG